MPNKIKILYGVAGEGSGHSSRSIEVGRYLERGGYTVKMISYGRGYKNLKPYFDVKEIFGFTFVHENNEIKILPTLIKNFLKSKEAAKSLKEVLEITNNFQPDVIFSDFEPITALAARAKKIPLISIGNQHRLTRMKIGFPMKYRRHANIAKSIVRMMILGADAYLVTAFIKHKIIKRNTFAFPPILRKEIIDARSERGDYILVYATFGFEKLIPILKNINKKFIIYGFNKNEQNKNLIFKEHSQKNFIEDLKNCRAVIGNAGFSLISEALYLKKPYLALPIKGQFEQLLNAYTLKKTGCGKYHSRLSKKHIENFLSNLNIYEKNLQEYSRENNEKIFKKIDELINELVK
ncbi:MAG: MJ1255/VC2487 family glycosyltransferase [Patescibacteria group bacterium]|jgi:uncharacterized protein (TIGR00661 family)